MELLDSQTVQVGDGLRLRHLVAFALAVIGILSFFLWVSDAERVEKFFARFSSFNVSQIEVQSDWPLAANQVKKWLQPLEGKSLILVSPDKVIADLQKRPWVDEVTLKKEYPSALRIRISSKRAVATSLIKGQLFFLDNVGNPIDNVTPEISRSLDLPLFANDSEGSDWDVADVLEEIKAMNEKSQGRFKVSQVVLGVYPQFKTYFANPEIEVIWNIENWTDQFENLQRLLSSPPSQIGQLQRINLVFPKKAIVSSSLSK